MESMVVGAGACGFVARPGRGRRTGRQPVVRAVGGALCQPAAVDCGDAVGRAVFLASPFRQGGRWLVVGLPVAVRAGLWSCDGWRESGACAAGRVHPVHDFADRPVYRGWWHLHPRQSAWRAGAQYGHPGDWCRAGQRHGHDRRLDAHDPAADPRQRQPQAHCACGGVLHLHRLQCGRLADTWVS